MFKRYIRISVLAFLGLGFFSCEVESTDLLEPIPTLQVRAGIRKGFDLGVYKRDPSAKLWIGDNPGLELQFLEAKDSLYILAESDNPALHLLQGKVDGQSFQLLVRVAPMVRHRFIYIGGSPEDQVFVMGGFNDWSRTGLRLTWDGKEFQREVFLSPQRHEYKFVVNGAEILDPLNPDSVSNNLGGWNSLLDLSSFQSRPAGRILKQADDRRNLKFNYLLPVDQVRPTLYYVLFNNHLLHNDRMDFALAGLTINKGGLSTGILRITGLDSLGRLIPENLTLLENGEPLHPADQPDDWHFSVLYSLMVDRFLDGNPDNNHPVDHPDVSPLANWKGGDLKGIIRKLEEGYFRDLGVNSLWLSPLQLQPDSAYVEWVEPHRTFTGYHGYWPVAARKLDPRFGTAEELKRLVTLAHQQGIKVILDFVSNHVHRNHPYYREHPDWFTQVRLPDGTFNIRRWDGNTRLTTWFDTFLPSFNYLQAPAAIQQVTEDALWWLEEFDLDGFRQDAVKHVPHRFWREFTRKIRQLGPERNYYQIGETFGSDELILSYVNPGELTAQFNIAIYFNARGPFSADQAVFGPLAKVLEDNLAVYGPVNLMGNITSSHDQVRFMAFADGQMSFSENGTERAFTNPPEKVIHGDSYLKLANFQAFNSTLPGVPVVYYGEEIGHMGAGDPDNRRMMKFNWNPEETALEQEFARLNRLRTTYPALALGDWLPLLADGPLLAYLKVYFDERILVAFNQSAEPRDLTIDLPLSFQTPEQLCGRGRFQVQNDRVSLTLPPYSHLLILGRN
jgi:glycosidase